MKLINSKKAIGVDDFFPLLFAIIAFIIIIMLLSYSHGKEAKEITYNANNEIRELESYDLFRNFLSKEISVDSIEIKTINMADFIKIYYLERDSSNEGSYYSKILFAMQEMFNPLEYCYLENDIKLKRGYQIFITENPDEKGYGTSVATDRKFSSETYSQDQIKSTIVQPVALPNSAILYIIYKESGLNAVDDKSCPIRK